MRVPIDWLSEYVEVDLTPVELSERLAMTGTEVARVLHHGPLSADNFVVGKVLSAEQHPDADRLRVCSVDSGDGEPRTIVCGAPNVAAGQTVAVALPGAVMPDGTKLGEAKLRGIKSSGMILAEDELGIGGEHDGIMVLEDDLAAGTPLGEVFAVSSEVLEPEVTPNRGDCGGLYGIAREVHAATGAALSAPPWIDDPGAGTLGQEPVGISVTVESAALCPRFTARIFENVTIAPSPIWLKARLAAAGQRSISNVVDITNYVMLVSGHPLHAFDLDQIAGGELTVRSAQNGEKLTTLDGEERVLDSDICLIADADGPTSLAGVMGGSRSEVSDQTTRVLLEVAVWDGANINRTSTRLGLRSEASSRFEKGLSPEGALEAQAMATALMLELTGATLADGTLDVGGDGPPADLIRLRDARIVSLLGTPIERERSQQILESLGFSVSDADDGLDVTVPHWRRDDVTREADLIEEVARINGLDSLPATLPINRTGRAGGLSREQRLVRRAEDVLVGRGLSEIVGWSFTDPQICDRLLLPDDHPLRALVVIENPMSSAQSVMRPSILPSLLDAAAYNLARGAEGCALFESGSVYRAGPGEGGMAANEHHGLGAIITGPAREPSWGDPQPPAARIQTAHALVSSVLGALGIEWQVEDGELPFLHPGRTAMIATADGSLGWFGEVHPAVAASWEIEQPIAALAIDIGRAAALAPSHAIFSDLTSFPPLREDLAVIVPSEVSAASVVACIIAAGSPLVSRAEVFDVYSGEQVVEGRVSLALHVDFAAADRTLSDEDVAPLREKIVAALKTDVGGELRG
jgi:phenylalanyl-tRNA synthetase beta chain